MASRLVRTPSGGSFTADITPADVVDRCDRCRLTIREGDMYCAHLAAQHGHAIARVTSVGAPTPAADPRRIDALMPVFRAPVAAQ